ncbi:F3 protein [Hirschfeldia incana]|nr:F3 protein [Hirschfeldia incana]
MEHRKLSGSKETMAMKRNLEEKGHGNSKIATPESRSRQFGQKNTQDKPSKVQPDQATPQITGYMIVGSNNKTCSYKVDESSDKCKMSP